MRKLIPLLAVGVLFTGLAFAAEEVTITGDAVCGKCALKESKTCVNTITTEKDGKKVTYYLTKKYFKEMHQGLGVCTAAKDTPVKVKATGKVEEKDGKLWLDLTKAAEKVE